MDIRSVNMILVIGSMLLPCIAMATEFVVGDHHGWATGFNYTAWAEGKVFYVGDSLIFRYGAGQHNVYKVNATEFQSCTVPKNSSEALTSGSDVILLATPGKKWYLCGVGEHCSTGQKLSITVIPTNNSIAPSQPPSSSTKEPASPSRSSIAATPQTESESESPAPAPAPAPVEEDGEEDVPDHFGRVIPNKKLLIRGILHY